MIIPDSVFNLLPNVEQLLYWAFILVVGLAIASLSNKLTQAMLGDDPDPLEDDPPPSDREPEP